MSQNRALIVDDSRTAQARLAKMLAYFDLQVDTAFSAEEAFGYLSYRKPVVIFLDHHMEGMDGLAALKVIKSNPDTALIPVIMYTSEQGDVYVGQARALGAIDILGKEVIKQANLEKVLASLGIEPKAAEQPEDGQSKPEAAKEQATPNFKVPSGSVAATLKATSEPKPSSAEALDPHDTAQSVSVRRALNEVQSQVSKQFELHVTKVRQEVQDSSKFVLRRLTKEFQDSRRNYDKVKKAQAADVAPPVMVPELEPEKNSATMLIMGLILLVVAFAGYHLYINNKHQDLARTQLADLTTRARAQETLINRLFEKVNENNPKQSSASMYADKQILLDALSWAVNVNNQIEFGETPLNSKRINILSELLSLLKASQFEGTIYLDTHLGNYCVIEDLSGEWMLPDPQSDLSDCIFLEDMEPNVSISDQVSVQFLNYISSAKELIEGGVDVELSTHNYSAPLYSYPPNTDATSAGQWNKIAQQNSRVAVLFSSN